MGVKEGEKLLTSFPISEINFTVFLANKHFWNICNMSVNMFNKHVSNISAFLVHQMFNLRLFHLQRKEGKKSEKALFFFYVSKRYPCKKPIYFNFLVYDFFDGLNLPGEVVINVLVRSLASFFNQKSLSAFIIKRINLWLARIILQ